MDENSTQGSECVCCRAAREDSVLLDYLDAINARANARNKTIYGWKFDINHNRASLTDHNLPALSIRQALRDAIGREQGNAPK